MHEAEELVGHEFNATDDLAAGLDEIAELGARNVLISVESGCYALVRDDREEHRVRGSAPRLEAVSRRSARATRCSPASWPAASRGKTVEDSVRGAVAAGAASVLEAGPGRFDREGGDPPRGARLGRTSSTPVGRMPDVPGIDTSRRG